jgi:plasmid stability protein
MASITIRNLDDDVKKRLRKQAAENGRSMEEEAREILDRETATPVRARPIPKTGLDLFRGIREVVEKYGGVELDIPPRTPVRSAGLSEEPSEYGHKPPAKPRRKRRK